MKVWVDSWYYRPRRPLPLFGRHVEFRCLATGPHIEKVLLSCGEGRLARAAFRLLTRLPLVITVTITTKEDRQ